MPGGSIGKGGGVDDAVSTKVGLANVMDSIASPVVVSVCGGVKDFGQNIVKVHGTRSGGGSRYCGSVGGGSSGSCGRVSRSIGGSGCSIRNGTRNRGSIVKIVVITRRVIVVIVGGIGGGRGVGLVDLGVRGIESRVRSLVGGRVVIGLAEPREEVVGFGALTVFAFIPGRMVSITLPIVRDEFWALSGKMLISLGFGNVPRRRIFRPLPRVSVFVPFGSWGVVIRVGLGRGSGVC